jgi:tripeptidyl-peptidase-1
MAWRSALKLLLCLSVVTALPTPASHVVHEERDTSEKTWVKRDRLSPRTILPVRIGLAQNNLEKAQEYLLDVSHPYSPDYGKHWTSEQVIEVFKPSDYTIETVYKWLLSSGIENDTITHTDNKAWFAFHATAEQLESLLHTEFHEFEHAHTQRLAPACDRYHVPEHIQQHVDYITPGIRPVASMKKSKRMSSLREKRSAQGLHHRPMHGMPPHAHNNLDTCDITITPACIAALYEIPPARLADPSNSMGIWESEVGYWDQKDLNLFFANLSRWIPKGTHPLNNLIDGAKAIAPEIADASIETMLDLDMAYPIGMPSFIL